MQVDLSGAPGNAYALLALVTNAARHLRLGVERTETIRARMAVGTYEEMLDVIDDGFPGVFDFLADPWSNPPRLRQNSGRFSSDADKVVDSPYVQ